jgi:DNA-binding response OmpR family regulator
VDVQLIVDDDARALVLAACLRDEGLSLVRVREPGARGLVLLDASDGGRALIAKVRAACVSPLVVVGPASPEAQLELDALEAGADDFVALPLVPRVLRLRVRRLVGRAAVCVVGPLVLDRQRRRATVDGRPLGLTGIEVDVVAALAAHAGQVVSREHLFRAVHDVPYDGRDRGLDVHVSRARPKLSPHGVRIEAVRGAGYILTTGDGR